ncbi:MAG TPA: transporter [Candidatus Didemnitutus sp.]
MLAALAIAADRASACSVCGCSLSSDWAAQGYPMASGLNIGLRLEYFEQSDLRSGTGTADRGTFTFPNDEEIQQRTVNRNTWLDLNYVVDRNWAVTASLPWHDRYHTTIAPGDTDISTSDASGFGDLRVTTRYQTFSSNQSFGFQVGLKLPTGRFDQNFASGPQAGELLDRGLQLGTGTWDLLAGVSWFAKPEPSLGCFFQAMLDAPLAERDGFLPSTSLTCSTGVRWLNSSAFIPQLQINLKAEGREHGIEADTDNSGSTTAYVSPGVTANLGTRTSAFAFLQLPVYQRVNGLQLEPRWILSTGVRWGW